MAGVSKHRASPTARRGRVGVLALALGLTVAIGGVAVGALPQITPDPAAASSAASGRAAIESAALKPVEARAGEREDSAPSNDVVAVAADSDPAAPVDSGQGRRIVFDQGDQRVWLIDDDESVERTYRVSGSRFENLSPGAYTVSSKNRHATAFDASGTMEYFVRFATGFSEPIGFHSVPRDNNGKLEQTKAQLGQRLSAGCVRQWEPDAIALWEFAPIGTKVFVTA